MTYLVINTTTSEIYQRNGAVAEFATYHQARQIRITMNDQGKVERDIEGTTSTWTDRPTPWQVIESETVGIKQSTVSKDRMIGRGSWTRIEEVIYTATGELNPIKRAPSEKAGRRKQGINIESMAREIASLGEDVKRLKGRIESVEKRMEGMELGEAKIKMMERKIKYKAELIELTTTMREKQKTYLSAISRNRNAQNRASQQTQSKPMAVRRRTS
jgi:hypothetical protein